MQKVLADAPNNKGKDSKDWKIPQGYKGAVGKARAKFRKDNADKRRKDKVNSLGTDTESEDESDSDDEDFSAPIGRSTLCALNSGFTKVNHGTGRPRRLRARLIQPLPRCTTIPLRLLATVTTVGWPHN